MKQEPVSRIRRSLFVFSVVGFCLGGSLHLAIAEKEGKVTEIVADGFITIALALSISYVAGTSIDYSGVLARIGGKGLSVTPGAETAARAEPEKEDDEKKPKTQNPGDDPDLAKG